VSRNRIAGLQLRGNTRPLPVRVYWPGPQASLPAPVLVFCEVGAGTVGWPGGPGAGELCRGLSEDAGLVVLSVSCDPPDAHSGTYVLEWAAEHAAELGGDPGLLLVGGQGAGGAAAAEAALDARAQGWPLITRQVLISAGPAAPRAVAGVAPATIVTVRHHPGDDGGRYAARLRQAGVEVDELTYPGRLPTADRVRADLGQALRRSLSAPR
jgi:acetyl esterase/lipase